MYTAETAYKKPITSFMFDCCLVGGSGIGATRDCAQEIFLLSAPGSFQRGSDHAVAGIKSEDPASQLCMHGLSQRF